MALSVLMAVENCGMNGPFVLHFLPPIRQGINYDSVPNFANSNHLADELRTTVMAIIYYVSYEAVSSAALFWGQAWLFRG